MIRNQFGRPVRVGRAGTTRDINNALKGTLERARAKWRKKQQYNNGVVREIREL